MAAGDLFWVMKVIGVNIGGLPAAVYILHRTQVSLDSFKPRVAKQYTYSYPRNNRDSSTQTEKPSTS